MRCRICDDHIVMIFNAMVLHKYNISYFRCLNCGFIQTEEPFWLNEAHSKAMSPLDVGVLNRNILLSEAVEKIIDGSFDGAGKFVDYGGGYGIFTRLMRDKGFNFYHFDPYCENLFAQLFSLEDAEIENRKFELLTAFELIEHLPNPEMELRKMLKFSDSVLITTELQPAKSVENPDDWWYFVPETGQHVSFFTTRSLEELSKRLHLNLYSDGMTLHLFSRKKEDIRLEFQARKSSMTDRLKDVFQVNKTGKRKDKRSSLIQTDFETVRRKLFESSRLERISKE